MKIQIPAYVLWIMNIIEQYQKEVYLVGGCVRDALLNREIHDYDLTTSMPAEEMLSIFKELDCTIVPTGLQHGTVTIIKSNHAVEVTTYRIDHTYVNHRSPSQISFTTNLQEDLKRRDFTINAIAYHPLHGVIDPFHGLADIEQCIIRCVGDPNLRLQEDALRILRAYRFHSVLSFDLYSKTQNAMLRHAPLLQYISKERIREEFNQILLSDHQNILQELRDYDILPYIIKEIEGIYDFDQCSPWHCYDLFQHTDQALNNSKQLPLTTKLALILHDIGKPEAQIFDQNTAHYHGHAYISEKMARRILKAMTYDRITIDHVCTLIRYHDYYVSPSRRVLRKFLSKLNNDCELAIEVLNMQRCDDLAKVKEKIVDKLDSIEKSIQLIKLMEDEKDMLSLKDLAIHGNDLIQLGYQGKQIGMMLQYAYAVVLDDPNKNNREYLLTAIQKKSEPSND